MRDENNAWSVLIKNKSILHYVPKIISLSLFYICLHGCDTNENKAGCGFYLLVAFMQLCLYKVFLLCGSELQQKLSHFG
jgi:hypothetical protein